MLPSGYTWDLVNTQAQNFLGNGMIQGSIVAILAVGMAAIVLGALIRVFKG